MTYLPRLSFLCALLLACTSGSSEPIGHDEAALSEPSPAEPEAASEHELAEPPELVQMEPAVPVPLDEGIAAVPLPVPPNADPDRVLALSEPVADLPAGFELLDARRVGDAVVVIHRNHTLWRHTDDGREQLDEQAEAPISVQGPSIAYARGEMPEFEIAMIADVATGTVTTLTEGYGPAWNPALGPDGSVVFVSGREGVPHLYRVAAGAAPEQLPDRGAFPASLRAPTFDGETFRFEDEAGQSHELHVEAAR